MANTFTITARNVTTGEVTYNASVDGKTYTGLKMNDVPVTGTQADVIACFQTYLNAYRAGKAIEEAKATIPTPSAEVAAMLNVPFRLV